MFIFGILVGAALSYIFHPQLDKFVVKTIKQIKDKRAEVKYKD